MDIYINPTILTKGASLLHMDCTLQATQYTTMQFDCGVTADCVLFTPTPNNSMIYEFFFKYLKQPKHIRIQNAALNKFVKEKM